MKQEKKQTRTSVLQKLTSIENLLKKIDNQPLSFKEACAYLGFKPSYLYKIIHTQQIRFYKPSGKMLFFLRHELDDWVIGKVKVSSEKVKEGDVKDFMEKENNIDEEDEEPP